MSETLYNDQHLEGLSKREVLENMLPDQLVNLILANGKKVSEIEKQMDLASNVLEGAYGKTVEQILDERNKNSNET